MANLIFLPIADRIKSGTYLLYDGALGTGGMLTFAEETLRQLAAERGKEVATHLYGQEINAETYAICKADLLLKGEGDAADNIVGGPEYSTLSNDAFPSRHFYNPQPLRTLEEIRADILALEKDTEGLLEEILKL
jgi:type I restriction enzyme M protein